MTEKDVEREQKEPEDIVVEKDEKALGWGVECAAEAIVWARGAQWAQEKAQVVLVEQMVGSQVLEKRRMIPEAGCC